MYKLVSLAVLALIGTSEAHKLLQNAMTSMSQVEGMDNLLQCKADEQGFEDGLEGFYENSAVTTLDGDNVPSHLLKHGKEFGDKPMLVVAYHPQCPHCKTMVNDYMKLATEANAEGKVGIAAVNMSLSSDSEDKLKLDGYPTVRFYTKPGHYEKFHDHKGRNYEGFKHFL